MALSDSDREQDKKRPNRSIAAETNKRYSDKQKLDAIHAYLAIGNLAMVSRMSGIPEITLRVWKASEWWARVVEDLKHQEKVELSNRMKRIVEAAHTVVENRLVNGDPVLTKTGEIVMKPVAMKDAHRVAVDLQNQRGVLERTSSGGGERESSNDEKLKQLAEKFAEFATLKIEQQRKPKIEVTDVIFVEQQPTPIEHREASVVEVGGDEETGETSKPTDSNPAGTS